MKQDAKKKPGSFSVTTRSAAETRIIGKGGRDKKQKDTPASPGKEDIPNVDQA